MRFSLRVTVISDLQNIKHKKGVVFNLIEGISRVLGMRDSNADLFDPRTIMDSDCATGSLGPGPVSDSDFAFAFNDSNFSDRVLRIEIIPDLPETKSNGDGCTSIADWARNRKRRREDIKKDTGKRILAF